MEQIQELKEIVAKLRGPGGCPWDQEQTHETLCEHLIEEYSELLDTIDRGDMEHMREELGDVLLHVFLHAQIAEEAGHFGIEDVAKEISEKLVRRHPHVFGDVKLEGSEAVMKQWEEIKKEEKAKKGEKGNKFFKDLPPRFPALLYARYVYRRMLEGVGESSSEDKVEITEEEAGEELFGLVTLCEDNGIDPESALRKAASRIVEEFEDRLSI